MTDLLILADPDRTLVNWLLRQRGASLAEILAHTQAEPATMQAMLDNLIAEGFLTVSEATDPAVFKPNLVSRRPRTMPDQLWKAVEYSNLSQGSSSPICSPLQRAEQSTV